MQENWSQILARGPEPRLYETGPTAPRFNDPVSSIVSQHGPNGEQQQYGEWTNAEMNTLSYELETSTDRHPPPCHLRPHAADLRAGGPGLYRDTPERDIHRQAEGDQAGRRRTDLRDGLPGRTIGADPAEMSQRRHDHQSHGRLSRRDGGSRHRPARKHPARAWAWSASPVAASRSPGWPHSACFPGQPRSPATSRSTAQELLGNQSAIACWTGCVAGGSQ